VPLLIKLPAREWETNRESGGTGGCTPTLLQAVGVEIPQEVQGESLLEIDDAGRRREAAKADGADAWHDRAAYAESDYPFPGVRMECVCNRCERENICTSQAPRRRTPMIKTTDAKAEHNLASASVAVA